MNHLFDEDTEEEINSEEEEMLLAWAGMMEKREGKEREKPRNGCARYFKDSLDHDEINWHTYCICLPSTRFSQIPL